MTASGRAPAPDPGPERIQKVLARAGIGSRRHVEELVAAGRVRVNGARARLGARVDPHKDVVEVDGSRVPLAPGLVHYLANKPVGMVSTADDPDGRPTVVDLVDPSVRVWPVGRLDVDTEGAIVLTNDGDLTHRLTHPSFEVPKTYLAEVRGAVRHGTVVRLARGIELDDGPTAPADVAIVDRLGPTTLVEITLREGRNRQVRRMFEAVGHPVVRLARTAIGPLELGRLKPGSLRRLAPDEVRALYRAAGL
ncbi:MAG TPA: pseudouridine synthase [Actinomycetota bacterium]|nr:pseudouridine synthase [Actinomycetota bacterium]